ncbi:hypothetical protein [Streptomyces sp. PR69]|uniref:hypothetical protein n=1 Tax=Streptomyces sp. PR69 TaxID=2984950 RepID=UPI0022643645|nr:hypothetical protein [Streptomyces sp. PR69]
MSVLDWIAVALLAYGLGVALVFRILPAAAQALAARRRLARLAHYLRMTWSAR